MIGYVTLGTSDIARAGKFYDDLLVGMGAKRVMEFETFIAWGTGKGPALSLTKPYDGKPATVGNGVMVALGCRNTRQVDELYAKAISLGATDEGPPGDRGNNFYVAYFRDLDGNKLNFFHFGG